MPLFVTPATSRSGTPFPDAPLDAQLEMAFGANLTAQPHTWTFTDLTPRLMATPISITRGVSPGASEAAAQSGQVELTNADGWLTPRNPGSPWTITRAVPARLRVYPHTADVVDDFDRPAAGASAWGTVEQPWAWVATVPYDLATDFALTGAQGVHRVQAANHYRISYRQMDADDVDLYGTVTLDGMPTDGACNVGFAARIADANSYLQLRARVIAASGAVWVDLLRRVTGVETTLASVDSGLTYTPGMPLHLHGRVDGPDLHIKVWAGAGAEPAVWTASATDTVFTQAGLGHGIRSGITNTATALPGMFWDDVAFVPFSTRLAGYADDWQPTILPAAGGTTWSQVRVRISGVSRRLQRGQPPARSPIRAAAEQYRAAGKPLVGYWPLEDASDSTRGASALDDAQAMTPGSLPVGWAGYDPPPPVPSTRRWGTAPIADLSQGGRLTGTARRGTSSPVEWAVRMLAAVWAPGFGADIPMMELRFTHGTWTKWVLVSLNSGFSELRFYTGEDVLAGAFQGFISTTLAQYQIDAIQSGGNVDIRLWQGDSATSGFVSQTIAGTLGRIDRVIINPSSVVNNAASNDLGKQWAAGHVQVWDGRNIPITADSYLDPDTGQRAHVWQAWAGEAAHRRVARLCAEAGVPVVVTPVLDAGTGTPMGAQADATLLELLADCAATDGGIRYEKGFALAYLPRGARYNLTPSMVIDLAQYRVASGGQADVLKPVWDDQGLVNDATVTRVGGSEGRYEDEAHIAANGRYADSRQSNLVYDTDAALHASWDVRLGTVDDVRYPELPIDLVANPGLITAWLGLDIGARIDRTNPPASVTGAGVISQILDGYTETLAPTTWSVRATCSPYGPWDVAELDGDLRPATDGCVVAGGGLTVVGLSMVVTNAGVPWTQDPADYPLTLQVGAEQVVASGASTPAGASQTITLTARGANGTTASAHPAGTPVDVAEPAYLPL
ncbi:hypothetical protein [Catenuloplanes indicus]|uniref:Uncharacterized protein n=1 Tax=Catenuloplanes indicus TaxID=137267 RepID=A0AAE3W980_9ACTN|nr:hypothetical protein [Catenuloplanes indicus]MDQ0371630.1 hypothetical protein [Catenuloplanes indicus]